MRHLAPWLLSLPAALNVPVAGQTLLRDINPGAGNSYPYLTAVSGNRLFFTANDGVTGRELWTSDGTAAGTMLVVDLVPGANGADPGEFVPVLGGVAFRATMMAGPNQLWFSDGTAQGTARVTHPEVFGTGPFAAGGDRSTLYFVASTQTGAPAELFQRTGYSGVVRITDFHTQSPGSQVFHLLAANGQRVWFSVAPATGGIALYVYDGSLRQIAFPAGTSMVNGTPRGFDLAGKLWFEGYDPQAGFEPWVADPLSNSAMPLGDVNPGTASSAPGNFVAVGPDVMFSAVAAATGRELYRSRASAPAPNLVADVFPGAQDGVAVSSLFVAGNGVFFAGNQPLTGQELWRSDGTASGTALVRDVTPGAGWGLDVSFLVLPICGSDSVLFGGIEPAAGRELWISNGTSAGTRRLFDLESGPGSGIPGTSRSWAALVGTTLVFNGTRAAVGDELFALALGSLRTACTTCPVVGCSGTSGIPRFATIGNPSPGNIAFAGTLASARATSAATFMLDGPGTATVLAGGCTLFTGFTPLAFWLVTDGAGHATVPLPIPPDTGLLGLALRGQWAVLDAHGAYQRLLSFSNGCHIVIGN